MLWEMESNALVIVVYSHKPFTLTWQWGSFHGGPPCFCSRISSSEMDLNKVLRRSSSSSSSFLKNIFKNRNSISKFLYKIQIKNQNQNICCHYHFSFNIWIVAVCILNRTRCQKPLNSCVFPWQNFPRLWFFLFFFYFVFLGRRHPAWQNLTFRKVCEEDFVCDSFKLQWHKRERGGIEEEYGSCLFKCHFHKVNA